ncbi:NAD-glutamate dehydrogenase [Magnetospirillum sulfuroxidans]|uniref:NAD-glutamate dehydrogenase n=1 Tax=Magnetospirillum sulfuroxidans TaxID=611300 RepID=A0ABS5IEK0_9PROT|nr:NAD-glutamate dehydrogenase [Magnetospirillum sulfuroxidans]MBR9972769.1 NAD-glutamate dehydrogenase [Magnetospirillum sulfuroxidans]
MNHSSDFLRANLANDVTAIIHQHLKDERVPQAEIVAAALLAGLPGADLDTIDPHQFFAIAIGLLGFMKQRVPGQVCVRMFNPDLEADGWTSSHSVIEIVNDDMPFLLDSVAMRLSSLGLSIHQLMHPILPVDRATDGSLTAMGGSLNESVMHIQVDRQESHAHAGICTQLSTVLAEVRAAVNDWHGIRDRIQNVAAELPHNCGSAAAEDVNESVAFLQWLHDNHFTLLGYRRFTLSGPAEAPMVAAESGESLGILRNSQMMVFDDAMALAAMPDEVRAFVNAPGLLLVTKSVNPSHVHRPAHMDVIGVKYCDANGRVTALHAFIGLFTSAAYTRNPDSIPLLRQKVARVEARAAFPRHSHDAKALANILETYPRDELFQISEDLLFRISLGILRIQDRPRVALFVRHDDFSRFASCLVYLPRDRYDTPMRLAVTRILEQAYDGSLDAYYTQVSDGPLARLHLIIRTHPGTSPHPDQSELENRIAITTRSWSDHLQEALVHSHGEGRGLTLARRWRDGFPAAYRERQMPLAALGDVERLERVAAGEDIALNLYRPVEAPAHEARLKLLRRGDTVALSDILPILEAMGLRVITEVPHEIRAADLDQSFWLHDFQVQSANGAAIDIGDRASLFEKTLTAIWRGAAESDGFNRLVLMAGLDWTEVVIVRAYAKYLRQAGSPLSQSYVERALYDNPEQTATLVAWFKALFDPTHLSGDAGIIEAQTTALLDRVDSADDDRILRRFFNLISATLRTNWFQGLDYLSLKLDSTLIDDLPLPRPKVEIFVYSPRVEAVHLRGGKVARGGIRWSDRRDDFRTEILGLMKAQMVKNAVIVPVGAKGGFVVKQPPAEGGREALLAEGIACYQTMMRGLLDLTDNLRAGAVVPPAGIVRRDGDDPYLVVAADKGTASFSDIANALSLEYGFWLGDAFASGGSKGYDHKAMGITARGAWEAVKRHFRDSGIDIQTTAFTAIGIGDMSGDVFGNGMLCSPHTRLVAAFNHSHIFLDPNPDAALSFSERQRLFKAVKGWGDYDATLISAGGGVFSRAAKTIAISAEMAERFAIPQTVLTPNALIRVLLTAAVDLLFFGGIGSYIKAHDESHTEVGDRANEAIRVDGRHIRAKVIGEGANLGITQRGRVEMALAGIRLNTDAIDNSAGVDTSDHEVNIKILLNEIVAAGDLTGKQRDDVLASMTDDVAALVLRDNYLQTQALSVMEAGGAEFLDGHARFMRLLEKAGRLDRTIEFLPTDDILLERAAHRRGLTRPELSVLLAYAKIWLHDAVIASDLPDDPFMAADLIRYFPTAVQDRFAAQIGCHRLRREIVATAITNSMINRVGIGFVLDMMDRTGFGPADIARAYVVARDTYGLRSLWQAVEALDGSVPASVQITLLTEANRLLERTTGWVLRSVASPMDMGAAIASLAPGIAALEQADTAILPTELAEAMAARAQEYVAQGAPVDLSTKIGGLIMLASAADIVRLADVHHLPVAVVGQLYFLVGHRFGLGWLRSSAQKLSANGHWQKLAINAATEDLHALQRAITHSVLTASPDLPPDQALEQWRESRHDDIARADSLVAELRAAPHLDLSMLVVANRHLKSLADGG